ncbi:hypothetical protein MAHJHV47_46190 [Mycobacterium avium subsp. hominissuis]
MWFVVARVHDLAFDQPGIEPESDQVAADRRDDHATPAEILDDGADYVPTDRRVEIHKTR